jgi:hypothetical protein
VSRGLGKGDGYGDTSETFLERTDNATFDVAGYIFGLPAVYLTRNTRSKMSLSRPFGGMGIGDMVALADATHVGATGLHVCSAILFLIAQDARVRGDAHDNVPMEPTIYGRLASTMITAVSR